MCLRAEYATRKYKSHRAIPSHESVDKMLEGLEHSRPELFKRVMRDQEAKAAEEQEAEGDLEKTEEREFHPQCGRASPTSVVGKKSKTMVKTMRAND